MTTIKQTITEDIVKAIKEGDNKKRDLLRMAIDKVQKEEKTLKRDITNEEASTLLYKFADQLQEEATANLDAGKVVKHDDLIKDIVLLKSYLLPKPTLMNEEEIKHVISTAISQLEGQGVAPNKGNLIKLVMPMVKGKADNKLVVEVIVNILN
jgi:uncharacterized protein YqeY